MRKGIADYSVWTLVGFLLAAFLLWVILSIIPGLISGAEQSYLGCTNLHNVIAEATGIEMC